MRELIPDGELIFHDFDSCSSVAETLLEEGYVLLLSREDSLYVLNYIWTKENYADRNDVVFMDRAEFECRFYEDDEYEEDQEEQIRQRARDNAEREVWYYAKKLMTAPPSTVEKIFCLDMMSEEEKGRFWRMYPSQLTFSEVKQKIDDYEELRNAALGERIMDACLADLDNHNQWKYEQAMREEECETETYATTLNDTLPSV